MGKDFVIGAYSDTQSVSSRESKPSKKAIREKLKTLIFEKTSSKKNTKNTLSAEDISKALKMSKAEAEQLYKELNLDGEDGISEQDLILSQLKDDESSKTSKEGMEEFEKKMKKPNKRLAREGELVDSGYEVVKDE